MKLLISCSRASYYVGGTEVVVLHQALELARLGHQIVFVVRKVEVVSEYFAEFTSHISTEKLPITIEEIAIEAPFGDGISWVKWNAEAFAFGLASQSFYQTMLRAGIDLAITHLVTDAVFIPSGYRSVLHLHGSPHRADMLIDTIMSTAGRHYIAHSDSISAWWGEHYTLDRLSIFRNGIDTAHFKPNGDGKLIDILYVGRFLEHKGILDIISAAPKDARLVIAGSGPLEGDIRRLIDENNLVNATVVINPNNQELLKLYQGAKIFACPSHAKEGVLTTMLEAGASGCAIVTSSGSGMTDLANENNGFLVNPGDVAALSNVFQQVLANEALRIKAASAIRKDIASAWSWQQKGKELEKIYASIISL